MQNILFEYDRSTIDVSEMPKLDVGVRWLEQNSSVRFTIEGNADERGGQEYNIALGDERAAAVKKYFAGRVIVEARMDALSYGEEWP